MHWVGTTRRDRHSGCAPPSTLAREPEFLDRALLRRVGLAHRAAVVLGACAVERHITLDRAMWGSDQAASVEVQGFRRLVDDIRTWELTKGDGNIRVYESEVPIIKKLRRVGGEIPEYLKTKDK